MYKDATDQLAEDRFIFVGEPENPSGLITRFDLNQKPVYAYLYTLIADMELGLRELIRGEDVEWHEYIHGRQPDKLYSARPDVHEDALSCTRFGQLINIVTGAGLKEELGLYRPECPGGLPSLESLNHLRGDIAHYHPLVHTMRDTVRDEESGKRTAKELAAIHELIDYCLEYVLTPGE